jgi:hypothetical protein
MVNLQEHRRQIVQYFNKYQINEKVEVDSKTFSYLAAIAEKIAWYEEYKIDSDEGKHHFADIWNYFNLLLNHHNIDYRKIEHWYPRTAFEAIAFINRFLKNYVRGDFKDTELDQVFVPETFEFNMAIRNINQYLVAELKYKCWILADILDKGLELHRPHVRRERRR